MTITLNTSPRRLKAPFDASQFTLIDDLRWKRVRVAGYSLDSKCKALSCITSILPAGEDDRDGIVLHGAAPPPSESTPAFQYAGPALASFKDLAPGWDSYNAMPLDPGLLDFALEFIRGSVSALLVHDIEQPSPFVAPTSAGGVQFEWKCGGRELEIEIAEPRDEFKYLRIDSTGNEEEGDADRWFAIRLVRWVATGEEP